MNPYNFSLLCFGFCTILLATLIFLKRNDQIGQRYLIFSLFCGGWALSLGVNFSESVSDSLALFSSRLGNVCAIFIPVAWYHFILAFTGKGNVFRRRIRIFYIFVFLVSIFGFSDWFISSVRWIVDFRCCKPGPMFVISPLFFFFIVPLGFIELFKKIKASSGQGRRQIIGLTIATGIGFLGGGLTYFPVYNIPLPQYGLFITPFYAFALAYFMIKRGLFDVEELAQAAHRDKLTAIGVLAASINHEVRNPLFIIKGLAESCLERQKEGIFSSNEKALKNANEAMRRSIDQADRAMDIIKRLSLFAKAGIDSEIRFESVRLVEVIENILPLVRYELAAHNITFTREIPQDLPTVRSDRRYLEEVLFNLFVNAIQAIKETGKHGEIKISALTTASVISSKVEMLKNKDGRVIITVQDTGSGISAEKLQDIFRPFYTTKEEGTGLGLYITKQLVERNGGNIRVCSKPGGGTKFVVTLVAATDSN